MSVFDSNSKFTMSFENIGDCMNFGIEFVKNNNVCVIK